MKNFLKSKYFFNLFLIAYLIIGIFLSLNVGITHDEIHSNWVWELNKKKILNIFFNSNYDVSDLSTYHGYYGIGFYLISAPLELIFSKFIGIIKINDEGSVLLLKHPTVFLFFLISGFYFKKIIYLISNDRIFSNLSTILYLTYPYLLGHSLFNIKDTPFMSIWLICTYYLIKNLNKFFFHSEVKYKDLLILAILTAYLFSLRINGVLIFLEYLIFLIVYLNVFKLNLFTFLKILKNKLLIFSVTLVSSLYILYPSFWTDPVKFIESVDFFGNISQTVCTVTLGECMKTQDIPASYLFIWLFFKLPLLILFGIILFPFVEKKIFNNKENKLIIGSLTITAITTALLFVILKINLYDELRQMLFLFPIIFIISLISIYNYKKKFSLILIIFYITFFSINNFKSYPFNYLWLNNFTHFLNINKNFEKDYWGVSTKLVAEYFNGEKITKKSCIISNRIDGIGYFLNDKAICLKTLNDMHKKNYRPFYVALTERALKKGTPNNCNLVKIISTKMNFGNEDIALAKIYKCT